VAARRGRKVSDILGKREVAPMQEAATDA